MPTVVLLGTLDTKGEEYAFLRDRLREHGVDVLLVDAGVHVPSVQPDIGREELSPDVAQLAAAGDRGAAVTAMAEGAERVVTQLHADGRLDGILALGGSGGSSIATRAMRALPVGVPKLMVSTVASGDTRPYVGAIDVTMMYSVVDISGVNRVSARIMANAAGARASRGARLRGARLPRDGSRRAVNGGARARRLPRRDARRDHDGARGRARRRRSLGGTRAARGGGCCGTAAGRLTRRARHGQLRAARHGSGEVRGAEPLRAQHHDHAHAHGAGGVRVVR